MTAGYRERAVFRVHVLDAIKETLQCLHSVVTPLMCVDKPASSWLLPMPRRRISTRASATAILTPWCPVSYYAVRIALQLSNKLCSREVDNPSDSLLSAGSSFHGNNTQCVRNSMLRYFQWRRDIPMATFPSGLLIVQSDKSHNAPFPIFHNSPFSTEICTILFWMVYCGVWAGALRHL